MNRKLASLKRTKLWALYQKARKSDFAWGTLRARDAFRMAKAEATPHPVSLLNGLEFRSTPLPSFTGRKLGFDVKVEAVEDEGGCSDSIHRPKSAGRHESILEVEPYGTFSEPEGRRPDRNSVRLEIDRDSRSMFPEGYVDFSGDASGYGNSFTDFLAYAKASGMAKEPAFLAAQKELRSVAERAWAIVQGETQFVGIRATVSRDGVELGESSCWRFELGENDDAENCLRENGPDQLAQALDDAGKQLARLRKDARCSKCGAI